MKERPILMSGPMVRAIFASLKTQTRRTRGLDRINQKPNEWEFIDLNGLGDFVFHNTTSDRHVEIRCPYGDESDNLWVRETWKCAWTVSCGHGVRYIADDGFRCFNTPELNHRPKGNPELDWLIECYGGDHRTEPKRPSIFMPRWASRLLLENKGARPERVQMINEEDAVAEGYYGDGLTDAGRKLTSPRLWYSSAWDSLNKKRGFGWDVNPWVWAVDFKRLSSAPAE